MLIELFSLVLRLRRYGRISIKNRRFRFNGVVTDWCLAIHACSLTEWCLGRRVGAWGRGDDNKAGSLPATSTKTPHSFLSRVETFTLGACADMDLARKYFFVNRANCCRLLPYSHQYIGKYLVAELTVT